MGGTRKQRRVRRALRAVALLIAAAATAAGLAGGVVHSAAPYHAVADDGVIHSEN